MEINKFQRTSQQEIISDIVNDCFPNVCQVDLVSTLIDIFTQVSPIMMRVGRYRMLINTQQQFAMVDNLERVLDYFSVVSNSAGFGHSFSSELLDDEVRHRHFFEQMQQNQCRQYPLNFVMWQIFSQLIPTWVNVEKHHLQLKTKFIPNFSMMQNVSIYAHSVLASCMNTPKTIHELDQIFEQASLSELNRILLLSILTGVADTDVLLLSHKHQKGLEAQIQESTLPKNPKIQQTTDVKRANKTGFFKRLLKKLGI